MSLIPEFELGLWNAWILVLPTILVIIISGIFLGRRETYESKEEMARHTEKEKKISKITFSMIYLLILYSVFVPLRLGTAWFYTGFVIYSLGTIFLILANLAFITTPVDKPVTKGIYRFSRHPINFSFFLILMGIGTACVSLIFILCGLVFFILMNYWLPSEERWCLELYGDSYKEYMNRTPRWIGIPKSKKKEMLSSVCFILLDIHLILHTCIHKKRNGKLAFFFWNS